MNTREYMILIKDEIKTSEIRSCNYNREIQKWDIKFNNGKVYSYAYPNVKKLTDPTVLNPNMYHVGREGREFFDISAIYVFKNGVESYWHICFGDGSERDYRQDDLHIIESCLNQSQAANVFEYIKQISGLCTIKNDDTGEKLLSKQIDKISFVGNDVALAKYLNPSSGKNKKSKYHYNPIFPFGCNSSQYKAVKNAMENQICVIQGPPGTGKTQTILNIVANILLQGKTVQIVSNNNSATENVYEKLSASNYNLGFIVATLGNSKNKEWFIEHQKTNYPDFSSWKTDKKPRDIKQKIAEQSEQLKTIFEKQEKLAHLRQELSQLVTEQKYFDQYVDETDVDTSNIKSRKKLFSKHWMELWQECQMLAEKKNATSFWVKIKIFLKYRSSNWNFYKQPIAKMITSFQAMYYAARLEELSEEIADIENYLKGVNKNLLDELCEQSMILLKDHLARKYEGCNQRKSYSLDDLWKNPYDVLFEYPVILSTTFSSRNSLNTGVVYDYLIMDEASQVDVATGALALSCARNAVIVGDTSDARAYLERLEKLLPQTCGELNTKLQKEIAITKAGIAGEDNIVFELKNSGIDMVVLHDIYIETETGLSAQIDFIVVTAKLIYVIECKNLFGNIEINNSGAFIRTFEYGGKRVKEGIYSPITQNERHLTVLNQCRVENAGAFMGLLKQWGTKAFYKPLVVLANPKTIVNDRYAKKEIKEQVIRADQLVATIKRMNAESKEPSSSLKQMQQVAQRLLDMNMESKKDYFAKFDLLAQEAYLEKKKDKEQETEKIKSKQEELRCPKCGAELVLRTAQKGSNAGKQFYGCKAFPKCKYIRNMEA